MSNYHLPYSFSRNYRTTESIKSFNIKMSILETIPLSIVSFVTALKSKNFNLGTKLEIHHFCQW